ncbi:MAG: ATPase [Parvibaculum sp.]|nr:ATPase [Parvibaculum sp.]|tara:strand:- start:124 stop:1608 length:1485 start_codon:yes stop_codon:yes gene_type:complete
MIEISEQDIQDRMRIDNPWWETGETHSDVLGMQRRAYFDAFFALVEDHDVRRAVVLMGPRRVGKTVMLFHLVQKLLASGVKATDVLYLSLDTPLYNRVALEKLLRLFVDDLSAQSSSPKYILFDEVQYLKDWEVHLKSLVDTYREVRFVVSGSAAAALRMKSKESGAGRFTDFMLPPLTFSEFLDFLGLTDKLITSQETTDAATNQKKTKYATDNIRNLNDAFSDYLTFGGYPELVVSEAVRANADRYIRSDIVDSVLLRDLPSLYGIGDIQELNSLFMTLAYNTGQEVTLEGLSKSANVAKNTLKKYLEYLEAAFLIKRVDRVDRGARKFQRATSFKVYLATPSLRAALFGPIHDDDEAMGALVETAIFSQWFHSPEDIRRLSYARWDGGEVDLVYRAPATQKPWWAVEVKWSDAQYDRPGRLGSLIDFVRTNQDDLHRVPTCTTKTKVGRKRTGGVDIDFVQSAIYCYTVGRNLVRNVEREIARQRELDLRP